MRDNPCRGAWLTVVSRFASRQYLSSLNGLEGTATFCLTIYKCNVMLENKVVNAFELRVGDYVGAYGHYSQVVSLRGRCIKSLGLCVGVSFGGDEFLIPFNHKLAILRHE